MLCALLALSVSYAAAVKSQPKLKVIPEFWDLGKIKGGSTYNFTYKVYNAGRAPLKINNVRASCGCTNVNISTREVLPYRYATLEASYTSGSAAGKFEKNIYVESNAPSQEMTTVKIKGEVIEK